jgi:prepilin-type N-terminal cleavage/methylation domain-containing protein
MRKCRVKSYRAGFTIVELAIVVTIIGILATIALPRIDVVGGRANATIHVIGTTLLAVQRQALTQQHDVIVGFHVPERQLRVHEDRNNNGVMDVGEHTRVVPLGESIVFGIGDALPRDHRTEAISFTKHIAGIPVVIFRRDGSASEGGGIYLTSTKAGTRNNGYPHHTRHVVIERSTGRTTAYRFLNGTWRKVF